MSVPIVVVVGAKGGCGATTLAVETARRLRKTLGGEVALVDADFTGRRSVAILLDAVKSLDAVRTQGTVSIAPVEDGIVAVEPTGPRLYKFTGMVEKPSIEQAPSAFAIMGRYVLTPDVFDLLQRVKPGADGEIQLTDALLGLSKRRGLYGYEFKGIRYDLGDRVGFLTAQIGYGLKRPELRVPEFRWCSRPGAARGTRSPAASRPRPATSS